MIPVTLNLKNFMSYRNLELDFSEIHIACLSGENGAGKSSILDAITWCLWEQARASSNEDLIRLGESDMSAELIFRLEDKVYRIMRSSRKKTKTKTESSLEFQVLSDKGYKSLTGKSIKETQSRITETVKMDYPTFVNSAFILQGKADEFTTKSPTERKKVLAEILNLKQFDILQDKAKEKLKDIESEKILLAKETEYFNERIKDEELVSEKLKIDSELLLKSEENIIKTEAEIKELSLKREEYANQLSVLKQIYKTYTDNKNVLENLNKDTANIKNQIFELENIIKRKEEIEENFKNLNDLKKENEIYSDKLIKVSDLEKKINQIENEINKQRNDINLDLNRFEERKENNIRDKNEYEKLLKDKIKVSEAYIKLEKARENEELYQKKFSLSQKLNEKKIQLQRKLDLEIQELKVIENGYKTKINERKKLIETAINIDEKIEQINKEIVLLEAKSTHRENIKEKGTKLRSDIEHNKKLISDKENEVNIFRQKIDNLKKIHEANCPMCTRHLDDSEKQIIVDKYNQDIKTIDYEIEKLNVDNSMIEKKMEEYRNLYSQLNTELKGKDLLQKQLGELEKVKSNSEQAQKEIESLVSELRKISLRLQDNKINDTLQSEISSVENQIKELDYNPEKLSLIQAEVNNWKWAELKNQQIKDAEDNLNKINEFLPKLEIKINFLRNSLEDNKFAIEKVQESEKLKNDVKNIDYNKEKHQILRQEINNKKMYEQLWTHLQQSVNKNQSLNEQLNLLDKNKENLIRSINENTEKINKIPEIESLFNEIRLKEEGKNIYLSDLRKENNDLRTEVSKNTEKIDQYKKFKDSMSSNSDKQKSLDYEIRLYKELINAFGKNGIQAVIIENAIPEIENAANQLLNRITEGRMNVSFNTRKENKTNDKIKETLDIFISDELGTRNYEMYSGGEAFRVNFAIRLALSKVLARRAGTRLKTLVIDEGFGTQDAKGISRLIEAINTVSSDFEKIIIITHMNDLKEAFPAKLEVYKTIDGSQVKLFY